MKIRFRWLPVSLIFLSLGLGGCASSLPTERGGVIGTLRVSGPNVFLNNSPGNDGDLVRMGSSLATGPGSSALLEFRDGGYLQLDQNTDPIFEWLEQSKCILVRIFKGQAYLKRERACVEGPNISLVLNSELNIRIEERPGLTEVTLVKGRADITVPAQMSLLPAQQFTVTERRIGALRTLTPSRLRSVVAWKNSYRFRPLPTPEIEAPSILFPPRSRPSRRTEPSGPSRPEPQPTPGTPSGTKPSTTAPVLEPGMISPELIRRPSEPVIR